MSEPVVIERIYDVAPDVLFAAWTDVGTLTRWWGCGVDQLWDVHEWEPVVGGAIHVSMAFGDERYEVRGRFTDVVEPARLTYDWENGQVVDVTIRPHPRGAVMTIEHRGLPEAADDGTPMFDIVSAGWSVSVESVRSVVS